MTDGCRAPEPCDASSGQAVTPAPRTRFSVYSENLTLEASSGVEEQGDLVTLHGVDPQMVLAVKRLDASVAEFVVEHETGPSYFDPKLYVDYGEDFSEANALQLTPAGHGRHIALLACPRALKRVRFDPATTPGVHRLLRIDLQPFQPLRLWSKVNSPLGDATIDAVAQLCGSGDLGAIHALNLDLNRWAASSIAPNMLDMIDPGFSKAVDDYIFVSRSEALEHYLKDKPVQAWYTSVSQLNAHLEFILREGDSAVGYELQLLNRGECAWDRWTPADQKRRLFGRHYLARGARHGLRPNETFDAAFYQETYRANARDGFENDYIHYLRQGPHERRYARLEQLDQAMVEARLLMDLNYYRVRAQLPPGVDPILHYVLEGQDGDVQPVPGLSPQYYLRRNTDLAGSGMSALGHYVRHGRSEGRAGSVDGLFTPGRAAYDAAKPTMLIAGHEASRTGAPIVALALAEHFRSTHNIVTHLGRGGELMQRFARASTLVAVGELDALDAEYLLKTISDTYPLTGVIVNSVESAALAMAALRTDLPCVALLHEFAEYTRPDGKLADVVAAADRVVVPAELVRRSIVQECVRHFGFAPTNIAVRPQGYIAPEQRSGTDDLKLDQVRELAGLDGGRPRKIVLGGGFVQIRKGVDLFVQTAAEFRRRGHHDVCFIWVGEGYTPDADITYALWLREMVRRSDVAGHVRFLPIQKNFDVMLAACDVFYLPSRLDPFPNVVVDALAASKPVVCFQDATGAAELFTEGLADGSAVAYCDVVGAANAIETWLGDTRLRERNADLVQNRFRFDHYAEAIGVELGEAARARKVLVAARDTLAASGSFDSGFHQGDLGGWKDKRQVVTDYVARASKGLAKFNPRPGFSDGLYRARHASLGEAAIPLLDALASQGPSPRTHDCIELSGQAHRGAATPRTAVHLHLYYPDLGPIFLERLNRIQLPIDLFITTSGDTKVVEAKFTFRDYEWGKVEVIDGPNRGRDIGPFLTSVLPRVLAADYDVVGHFHSKKTVAAGGAMGSAWRTYLLDTLLCDRETVSVILGRFQDQPELGLIFAEDRHAVGWSGNLDVARALAPRIGGVDLPDFPVFPLGTMFWSRPLALERLANRLDWP